MRLGVRALGLYAIPWTSCDQPISRLGALNAEPGEKIASWKDDEPATSGDHGREFSLCILMHPLTHDSGGDEALRQTARTNQHR